MNIKSHQGNANQNQNEVSPIGEGLLPNRQKVNIRMGRKGNCQQVPEWLGGVRRQRGLTQMAQPQGLKL